MQWIAPSEKASGRDQRKSNSDFRPFQWRVGTVSTRFSLVQYLRVFVGTEFDLCLS